MKITGSYPSTRLRRNRKKEWSRRLVEESTLSPSDLIWPIFICEGKNVKEHIKTMPGIYRYSIDRLEKLLESAIDKKIPMIALFPNTSNSKKDNRGSESLNKNNLICKALRLIKNLLVYGVELYKVDITPFSDVGEMTKEEYKRRKTEALPMTEDSYLLYQAMNL